MKNANFTNECCPATYTYYPGTWDLTSTGLPSNIEAGIPAEFDLDFHSHPDPYPLGCGKGTGFVVGERCETSEILLVNIALGCWQCQ